MLSKFGIGIVEDDGKSFSKFLLCGRQTVWVVEVPTSGVYCKSKGVEEGEPIVNFSLSACKELENSCLRGDFWDFFVSVSPFGFLPKAKQPLDLVTTGVRLSAALVLHKKEILCYLKNLRNVWPSHTYTAFKVSNLGIFLVCVLLPEASRTANSSGCIFFIWLRQFEPFANVRSQKSQE